MTIEFKLKEKEFVVLMLNRTYPKVLFLATILLCIFGWLIFSETLTNAFGQLTHPVLLIVFALLLLVYPLLSLGFKFRRRFRSNKMLQERVRLTLEEGFVQFRGESFTSRAQMSKLYKIVELKNYFLFYQSKNVFDILPKRAIGENLADFKSIIKTNSI